MCTKAMSSAKKGESKNALSLLISVFGFGFFHRAKPVSQQAQSACWRQHCGLMLDEKNPGEAAKRPEPISESANPPVNQQHNRLMLDPKSRRGSQSAPSPSKNPNEQPKRKEK